MLPDGGPDRRVSFAALAAVASAAAAAFRTSRLPLREADGELPLPKALVGVVAAAALIAVSLSQIIGTDFAHHASIVFAAVALGLLEALLILACYATLGRSLGLRRAT